jgi:hypothetical protein
MPAASKELGAVPIVIVERNGDLRASQMNAYTPSELKKKCKCKPSSKFEMHAEWAYSGFDGDANGGAADERFIVELWACDDGNAGQENKYEFPPPVDTILFFGACALVAKDMTSHHRVIPLTLEKWDKMYNFLFGGFDTLANCDDDEYNEEDELDSIPAIRKTKDGYLKDGFVVDNSDEDDDDEDNEEEDEDEEEDAADDESDDDDADDEDDEDNDAIDDACTAKPKKIIGSNTKIKPICKRRDKKQPKEEILVETLSELSEEAYEYPDD